MQEIGLPHELSQLTMEEGHCKLKTSYIAGKTITELVVSNRGITKITM